MNTTEESSPVVAAPAAETRLNRTSNTTDAQTAAPTSPAAPAAPDATALRLAIERLFSKDVLERNPLMLAYISSKMSVPLPVVAQHLGFVDPTGEYGVLVAAIQDSAVCVATPDGGIRPTYKQQQHTVILRDVPSSTPQEAILNILREKGCTGYKSIRSELNDTWFITFESEQDARDSVFAIRDATLDGKPIRARLKTESIAKSFYQAAMEQAQTQPWQSTPVVQFPTTSVPQQRFHQNRSRSEFPPHQTHGGAGAGGRDSGGPRNGRNRSRRQFNTVPPVDAPNAYHAMRMQAMWAAQFGHPMAAAPMMPMPPQQFVQPAEQPAPRGRRSSNHGGSRSSAASTREDGRQQRQPQPEGVPPVSAPIPVVLNGTGPHVVVAPHVAATPAVAAPGAVAVPMATPTSPTMRAPQSHEGKPASAGDEPHNRRGSGGGQHPRPRRSSGPNQRRDSDAAGAAASGSPRNTRSEGGKKPAGKKKPQQPSRKSERKPAESAPEFTEADFPVLSTVKPSTSATDLASGYAEALKRGANGHDHNGSAAPAQRKADSATSSNDSKPVAEIAGDRSPQDGDEEFQFFSTPPEPAPAGPVAPKGTTNDASSSPAPQPVVAAAPSAKPSTEPSPEVAKLAADFESFPYMDSSAPSTSRNTAWAGKKSFLEALRKQDQAA